MNCKICGTALDIDAEVCPKCGAVIEKSRLSPEDEEKIRAAIPALREALRQNAKASDTSLSDEERIKAAVPVLREALMRNTQQGWRCKVCGQNNPRSAVNCVKCGRNRIRTEQLLNGEYDATKMPKPAPAEEIVTFVQAPVPPVKEEPKKEVTEQPKRSAQTPIVYNYIYPNATGTYGTPVSYKDNSATTFAPYVAPVAPYTKEMEKRDKRVNRIISAILLLLSAAFFGLMIFPYITYVDGGQQQTMATGFSALAGIVAVLMGQGAGSNVYAIKFAECYAEQLFNGASFNIGLLFYLVVAVLIVFTALFVVISLAMNVVRVCNGKMKKGSHGVTLTAVIFQIILLLAVGLGGILLNTAPYGACAGVGFGLGAIVGLVVLIAMYVLGFFGRKIRKVNVLADNARV